MAKDKLKGRVVRYEDGSGVVRGVFEKRKAVRRKIHEQEPYSSQKFNEGYQSLRSKVSAEFGIGAKKNATINLTPWYKKGEKKTPTQSAEFKFSGPSGIRKRPSGAGGSFAKQSLTQTPKKASAVSSTDTTAPLAPKAPTASMAPVKKAPEKTAPKYTESDYMSRTLAGKTPGGFGVTRIARPGESHTEMNARYDNPQAAAAQESAVAGEAEPFSGGIGKPGMFENALKALSDIGKQASITREYVTPVTGQKIRTWNPKVAAYAQEAIANILSETYGRKAQAAIGAANVGLGVGRLKQTERANTIDETRNTLTERGLGIQERKLLQTDVIEEGRSSQREAEIFTKNLQLNSPKNQWGSYDVGVGLFRMALDGAKIPPAYRKRAEALRREFEKYYKSQRRVTGEKDTPEVKARIKQDFETAIAEPQGQLSFPTDNE